MMALSYARPELYYFVMILLQIPGSMVMASVALAVSTIVGNAYITLASPMICVGLITALPQRLGGDRLRELIYAPMDLGIWMNGYTLFCEHLIYCAIGLAATFAVFYLGVRRYKENEWMNRMNMRMAHGLNYELRNTLRSKEFLVRCSCLRFAVHKRICTGRRV